MTEAGSKRRQADCWEAHAIKNDQRDFPGGPVDKKSACQGRRHGFDPWSRKISQATKPIYHNY